MTTDHSTMRSLGKKTAGLPPPKLIFDDGSRIMMTMAEEFLDFAPQTDASSNRGVLSTARGPTTSLEDYYEIDRIYQELVAEYYRCCAVESKIPGDRVDASSFSSFLFRVAIQFPDELLEDAPDVCWLLEERFHTSEDENLAFSTFIFCLGDTTVGSCCPDEVAALHLQANVLVHYGHACLSPTGTLPVIYSFGRLPMDIPRAITFVSQQQQQETQKSKILVLYQVGYQHAMDEFCQHLSAHCQEVVMGKIPQPATKMARREPPSSCGCQTSECCSTLDQTIETDITTTKNGSNNATTTFDETDQPPSTPSTTRPLIVGGLQLPPETISFWEECSEYTILFIGDFESSSQQRQFVPSMLRFLSLPNPPQAYWTYSPVTSQLETSIPPSLNRKLQRRFFLSQKARDAHVFGILVSNLSQQHLVDVVKALQRRIYLSGKASYTFAVGKINPAKLANFAEIECFVLVACREHSLLDDEREYPVPVITPLELDVALGNVAWGSQPYTLDCQDVLSTEQHDNITTNVSTKARNDVTGDDENEKNIGDDDGDDDDDAPYFSLVTGKYMSKTAITTNTTSQQPQRQEPSLDLQQLPGQGQVMEYRSEAANFLKQREYQGMTTMVGQTQAKPAIKGQQGIASDYNGS